MWPLDGNYSSSLEPRPLLFLHTGCIACWWCNTYSAAEIGGVWVQDYYSSTSTKLIWTLVIFCSTMNVQNHLEIIKSSKHALIVPFLSLRKLAMVVISPVQSPESRSFAVYMHEGMVVVLWLCLSVYYRASCYTHLVYASKTKCHWAAFCRYMCALCVFHWKQKFSDINILTTTALFASSLAYVRVSYARYTLLLDELLVDEWEQSVHFKKTSV